MREASRISHCLSDRSDPRAAFLDIVFACDELLVFDKTVPKNPAEQQGLTPRSRCLWRLAVSRRLQAFGALCGSFVARYSEGRHGMMPPKALGGSFASCQIWDYLSNWLQ